ncbi:11184_t:CDS:2 [Acaulospora morrowiae]|uniref:11184_t:CDS:1 n=1 Tax=Acaulospora morrowiae TaxID=94023 RepID=A0A9N9FCP0_9GLOM|nr:11184_t:CDS:2 [Acaulospora morrowiae]
MNFKSFVALLAFVTLVFAKEEKRLAEPEEKRSAEAAPVADAYYDPYHNPYVPDYLYYLGHKRSADADAHKEKRFADADMKKRAAYDYGSYGKYYGYYDGKYVYGVKKRSADC